MKVYHNLLQHMNGKTYNKNLEIKKESVTYLKISPWLLNCKQTFKMIQQINVQYMNVQSKFIPSTNACKSFLKYFQKYQIISTKAWLGMYTWTFNA